MLPGLTNCSLVSSCREGCTLEQATCHQITVEQPRVVRESRERGETSQDGQTHYRAQLRVNAKGCGYPPAGKSSTWKNIF